jgi:hypothetical protein
MTIEPGTPELGEGQPPPLPFTRRGKGGKGALSWPFNLKDCLGEIANCQKC